MIVQMTTIWKKIETSEMYEVSNTGIVRNKIKLNNIKSRIKNKYPIVELKGDLNKTFMLYNLVAKTFINVNLKTHCIQHIDGNILNNCLNNFKIVERNKKVKLTIDNEIWYTLTICDIYEITKTGLVRNKYTKKLIKQKKDTDGYILVGLNINKKTSYQRLHRLLAYNFIPNPNNYKTIDHINRIRDDNNLKNLRWANQNIQDNNKKHAVKNIGIKISKYKDNKLIDTYNSFKLAAKSINIHKDTFSRLIKKTNEFYGYNWIKTLTENNVELFKPIIINNLETGYFISDYGTIKNNTGRLIKGHIKNSGYKVCTINYKVYYIHCLIAQTFLPNFYNKSIVNHKDGNKSNCKLYNLEWVTTSENILHSYNVLKKGLRNVNQYNLQGTFIKTFESIVSASKEVNRCPSSIRSVCIGKSKTSAGFIWKYT